MKQFHGVMPAIITPMSADGSLDEALYRQVMERNIELGVHGFWVAGGTGESVHLDDEENMRIAEIAADQARGRVLNILHVGTPSTRRSIKLAEHAAKVGIDAICCVPPMFYPPTHEEVVAHYAAVAAAAGLPFFVYNLPQCTGVEITVELMSRIQDAVPELQGLKHSALTVANIREFRKMGLQAMVGNSTLMLPALSIGASGCIDGPPNIAPERWVDIWNAWQNNDLQAAQTAQERASDLTMLIRQFGLQAGCKFSVSHRLGVDCGAPRGPLLGLESTRQAELTQRLESIGIAANSWALD